MQTGPDHKRTDWPMALKNPVFLAPMSGVSDAPFRQLAWKFGAGMVVSEMVASEAFMTGQEEMRLKAESAGLPVHMVQLAGREAHWMGEAARLAEASGAHVIDINMGCPSKRVTNGYSGSALMRDLDHATGLIDAVVGAVDVPVTLKMRLGWDDQSINAPELARRAEQAGIRMITVHGRTRNQFYKGQADWRKVSAVRETCTLPMLVNGDIASAEHAHEALRKSGADGVMVGRASYGQPWLPGSIAANLAGETVEQPPHGKAFAEMVASHYQAMIEHYGVPLGSRNARKHLDWYFSHLPDELYDSAERRSLLTEKVPEIALAQIVDLFIRVPAGGAAKAQLAKAA